MYKLSAYVEIAAAEYFRETGEDELDAVWVAELFQDAGVQDDYPHQSLIAFHHLVQKALTKKVESAAKLARFQLDKIAHGVKLQRKP